MKKAIAVFLLVVFLFQLNSRIGFIAWFSMNREAITETCCINKSRPELNCFATCYLNKKLAEDRNSESKVPELRNLQTEDYFFRSDNCLNQPVTADESAYPLHDVYLSFPGYRSTIDRPPAS